MVIYMVIYIYAFHQQTLEPWIRLSFNDHLFGLANRDLGSTAEAKDACDRHGGGVMVVTSGCVQNLQNPPGFPYVFGMTKSGSENG